MGPAKARHPGRLHGMGAGPDAEEAVGLPQAEVLEEDARHGVVVVLAGVDEHHLRVDRLEGVDDRLDLHEVGPGAGHADGSHGYRGAVCRVRTGRSSRAGSER